MKQLETRILMRKFRDSTKNCKIEHHLQKFHRVSPRPHGTMDGLLATFSQEKMKKEKKEKNEVEQLKK